MEEHPLSWDNLLDGAKVVFGWPNPVALAGSTKVEVGETREARIGRRGRWDRLPRARC